MTAETIEKRACCRCTAEFTPSRDWGQFCSTKCRTAFHNAMKAEGQILAPLVKAWTATRHAKPDTEEAEICAWARQQITEISRMFIDEDAEENEDGKPKHGSAVDYVRGLMRSGFLYVDRRR